MKITLSDIDSMIDTVQELKLVKECSPVGPRQDKIQCLIERQRKIYMILLHCTSQRTFDSVPNNASDASKCMNLLEAIRNLCPHVV